MVLRIAHRIRTLDAEKCPPINTMSFADGIRIMPAKNIMTDVRLSANMRKNATKKLIQMPIATRGPISLLVPSI